MLVLGRYAGHARSTGEPLEAAFAHLWSGRAGKLVALRQFTDSARFLRALTERDNYSASARAIRSDSYDSGN